MTTSLAASVGPDDRILYVFGEIPDECQSGYRFRLSDSPEILRLAGFGGWNHRDRTIWRVRRGEDGTTPTSHAEADVLGVADAWAAGTDEEVPSPFDGGGGITNDAPTGSIAISDGTNLTGSAHLTWDEVARKLGLVSAANGNGQIHTLGAGAQLAIVAADGDSSVIVGGIPADVGGELTLASGNGDGGGGGAVTISSGADTNGGDGGPIAIQSGYSTDGASGDIDIRVGAAFGGNSDTGGSINIVAGTGQGHSGGSVVIQAGAKVTGGSHGSVQLYSGDGNTTLDMGAAGFYILSSVGVVIDLSSLPTTDPGNPGQLFTLGAPSAGVPKALMVSGG